MSALEEACDAHARALEAVDRAFELARSAPGACVPCRRGCSACCAAVFDVHAVDALRLGRWLDRAEPSLREDVLARARSVEQDLRRAAAELAAAGAATLAGWEPRDGFAGLHPADVDALAAAATAPCPILGSEGECRAHADRPALCRLQGLPWADAATGDVLPDFCDLDERQAANRPSAAPLDALREARAVAREHLAGEPRVAAGRTCVAAALARWADPPAEPPRRAC